MTRTTIGSIRTSLLGALSRVKTAANEFIDKTYRTAEKEIWAIRSKSTHLVLTDHQYDAIFEQIVRERLSGTIGVPSPLMTLVGGQSGAGKTTISRRLADAHKDSGGAVCVAGDIFLSYHPKYPELQKRNDFIAARVIQPEARKWRARAIDHVISNRYNIVVESSMRDSDAILGLVGRFQEENYGRIVEIMAVPKPQSRLSTLTRFVDQRLQNGTGRYVWHTAHEDSYIATPKIVKLIESNDSPVQVDALRIHSRTGVLYTNECYSGTWAKTPEGLKALEHERNRPWEPDERRAFHHKLEEFRDRVAAAAKERPATEQWSRLLKEARKVEKLATPWIR